MAIPTTSSSAQWLLILAFLLLGIWSSTFKIAGNRWRFEFFSFDFALGSILFALISSYTFGAFGADLGFAEHLMIASKTNQALAFLAGGLFAFGTMMLLSGAALLGLSFSYAISTASAVLVLAALEFTSFRLLFLGVAVGSAILTIIFESSGAKNAEETLPAVSLPVMVRVRKTASGQTLKPTKEVGGMLSSSKGIIVSILSGLALGGMLVPFESAVFGQFGLGTYAGVVLFFAGAGLTTILLSFFFMNMPIHGGPTNLKAYLRGSVGQHILGFIGGALCAAGVLLITLLNSFPAETQPDGLWLWAAGLGAGLLAIALGLSKWHELSEASGSAVRSLMLGAIFLVIAIGSLALAMDRTAPVPAAQDKVLGQPQLPG